MVKLSLVVGILALASSANAACDYAKCGTDYSTAAGAAAGDMTKTCAAAKAWVDCFGGLKGCSTAEQMAVDMAKKGMASAMSQVESMCGGSSGGGDSGGSSSSTCDFQKCATDYATAGRAAAGDKTKTCAATKAYVDCFGALTDCGAMQSAVDTSKAAAASAMSQIESMCGGSGGGDSGSTSSGGGDSGSSGCDTAKAQVACKDPIAKFNELLKFNELMQTPVRSGSDFTFKAFNDYCANGLTVIGAYTKCAAANGCAAEAAQAAEQIKVALAATCKAGPDANSWIMAASKDDAFKRCVGDKMPTGATSGPTCDQAKKFYECGKDFPAGTTLNEECEAFKTAGDGCDMTCPKASTGAAADSSPASGGDTGAASSTQVSAAVLVAAVAFVGMAN